MVPNKIQVIRSSYPLKILYWLIFLHINAHYKFKTGCLTPLPLCASVYGTTVIRKQGPMIRLNFDNIDGFFYDKFFYQHIFYEIILCNYWIEKH
jgi:hypothetical protein